MGAFFTDKQGRVRPISGKKGGTAVVAAVFAGTVAFAGGALGGGSTVGGTLDSAVSRGLQDKTVDSKNAARKGKHDDAWLKLGLKRARQKIEKALECALHSYGQVREFFLHTPCRSLDRALFAIPDANDNVIVVSVAWVRMRAADPAARLRQLADTDGTGNVTPIAGELLQLTGVRFLGKHYASRRSGALVVIAEATPASGHPDVDLMQAIAQVAAEFPPP